MVRGEPKQASGAGDGGGGQTESDIPDVTAASAL